MTAFRAAIAACLLALARGAAAQSVLDGDPLDQTSRAPRITLGPIVVGEDHPLFSLEDFPIQVEGSALVEARWIEGSLKWVRAADDLPIPLARLRVSARLPPERALLRFRGRAAPFQAGEDGASVEIFVPLLSNEDVLVDIDGRLAAKARVAARPAAATPPPSRHAIDHSCSPWDVQVRGLDDALLSMNCRLVPVGKVGAEESLLDIHWAVAGVSTPSGKLPPLVVQLRRGSPARLTLTGPDGRSRVVELSASVPARWHRLSLAFGAGPSALYSSAGPASAAGSLMLYANLRLHHDDDLSIRAFEAATSQSPTATTFFNNLGLYFAYDAAGVWDDRLRLVALLGAQSVTFAPNGLAHSAYNEALVPQGFEISYIDAFGRRNRRLTTGVFLQPTANKGYQNYWLRYGGRRFLELNYISWRSGSRRARMWGASIGLPFAQIF